MLVAPSDKYCAVYSPVLAIVIVLSLSRLIASVRVDSITPTNSSRDVANRYNALALLREGTAAETSITTIATTTSISNIE